MRQLESTHAFKRDLKRELTGKYKQAVTVDLPSVVKQLQTVPLCLNDSVIMH